MHTGRYWGLFWIATCLSIHAVVVGKMLESNFFMMLFFWGFVAISALRGSLETAQSMAIVMIVLFIGVATATLMGHGATANLAYATFALYPALVSWVSIFFYIRYLRNRDGGALGGGHAVWRQPRVS